MNVLRDLSLFDAGSFRDPSGGVFKNKEEVYRSVFPPGVEDFEAARDRGVYDELIRRGLLLSHDVVDIGGLTPEGSVYCLRHPRLPMISYPWEWPFSMLKDAALIHLDAMETLIPSGFWLKDASAFNVQYDGRRMLLIDTLSVGLRAPDSPWVGYGQFCSHFLAPLCMAAYVDIRTLGLWRNYINGYPLDMATRMLPKRRRYRPGVFMHLSLHAGFQNYADRAKDVRETKSKAASKVSDRGLEGLIRSLRRTVEGVSWKPRSGLWERYSGIRTYGEEDVKRKSEYVEKLVKRLKPGTVWDLGANTGEFSLIAASQGCFVVSIDGDPACTEQIYKKSLDRLDGKRILPLTMDLANPSPGLGWNGSERMSLNDRSPADLVLALALIHHLVLSACVPLTLVASWFAELGRHLLVEYVPREDPMVKRLLAHRNGQHLPYSPEAFRSAFGKFFDFIDEKTLANGRKLILCKRRIGR